MRECSKRRRRVLAGRRGLRRQGWNSEVQGDEAHLMTLVARGERIGREPAPCGRPRQRTDRGQRMLWTSASMCISSVWRIRSRLWLRWEEGGGGGSLCGVDGSHGGTSGAGDARGSGRRAGGVGGGVWGPTGRRNRVEVAPPRRSPAGGGSAPSRAERGAAMGFDGGSGTAPWSNAQRS